MLLALGVALRGIAGPVPNGHFASIAAIGMAADNMWRWQTLLPIVGYFDQLPVNPTYYMHHPIALFWDVALLGKVFGFSDWVLRLPALVYVTLTPFLLFYTEQKARLRKAMRSAGLLEVKLGFDYEGTKIL